MAEPVACRIKARNQWQRRAVMAGYGVLAALGQAPFSLTILGFIGFAAAFWTFAGIAGRRQAFWAGVSFGTGYFGLALHWIVEPFLVDLARHGWMAPFALVFMAVGLSLIWGAAFALAQPRGRLALVLSLTGAELVRAYLFGGFPWAMPAYALVDGLAGQGAAWLGPHGLNLLLFASAAALSAMRQHLGFVALGALAVALSLWPLADPKSSASDQPIVRLVQPNVPQHQKWDPAFMPVSFDRALRLTSAGPARPDLIIWPETSVPAPLDYSSKSRAAIARAAGGVPVVAGILRYEGLRIYNSAVVLDQTGTATEIYDKHHLVPLGEYVPFGNLLGRIGIHGLAARQGGGFTAGPGAQLLDLGAFGKALPLICYEAVFPQDLRGTPERPDFLMQITNDAWFGNFSGPYQHLDQARMRAIEQGLPMLRAANTGVSAVIDPMGRIIASLPLNSDGFIDAALPQKHAPTLYARTGDGPLAAVTILLCLFGLRRRDHLR